VPPVAFVRSRGSPNLQLGDFDTRTYAGSMHGWMHRPGMRLLVTQSEARLAAEAEVRKQPEAEKPFSWTAEQDKMYQELSFVLGRKPE
jgi:hypothetical protein